MVMRLLSTSSFELVSGDESYFKNERYSILSHRWVGQEISFGQIQNLAATLRENAPQPSAQLAKIRGACDKARQQGFRWIWIDSCCINKSSTVEEAEAIGSMFRWYHDAEVCITYLSDVIHSQNGRRDDTFQNIQGDGVSVWFSRGWTLQELLAPRDMQFYDKDWQYIGSKRDLADLMSRITGIDEEYISGKKHFREACIATKMSWLASRTTTRIEDLAYSMLGIFDVRIMPQYGEGMGAFMRLQQELLATQMDESLFAWELPHGQSNLNSGAPPGYEANEWGLLAPSPLCFKDSRDFHVSGKFMGRTHGGFSMTQQGVQVPIFDPKDSRRLVFYCAYIPGLGLIMYWLLRRHAGAKDISFPLNCWKTVDGKQVAVKLCLRRPIRGAAGLKRIDCHQLELTPKRPSSWRLRRAKPFMVAQPRVSYLD